MTVGDPKNKPALVCFAVQEEARFFKPSPAWRTPATVAITGIGKRNAARSIRRLLMASDPSMVLTCGFAGGLNPTLQNGTIVFSTEDAIGLSSTLLQLGAKPGRFHCSPRVAVTAAEKQQLWESTGADAVEMESEVIRHACREQDIPSATVRVISDSADEDLPVDFNTLMTSEQKLSYPRLAVELFRSPGKILGLLRLQRRTTAAARHLGQCLQALLN